MFVANMKASVYPHGIDRWFFSPNAMTDSQFAFTSASLAGQRWGESDSWSKHNPSVGAMEDPYADVGFGPAHIHTRRFSDSGELMEHCLTHPALSSSATRVRSLPTAARAAVRARSQKSSTVAHINQESG